MISILCQSGIDSISPPKKDNHICFFCLPGEEYLIQKIIPSNNLMDLRNLVPSLTKEEYHKYLDEVLNSDWILYNSTQNLIYPINKGYNKIIRKPTFFEITCCRIGKQIWNYNQKNIIIITHGNATDLILEGSIYVSENFYRHKEELLDRNLKYGKEILDAEIPVEYPIERKHTIKIVRNINTF